MARTLQKFFYKKSILERFYISLILSAGITFLTAYLLWLRSVYYIILTCIILLPNVYDVWGWIQSLYLFILSWAVYQFSSFLELINTMQQDRVYIFIWAIWSFIFLIWFLSFIDTKERVATIFIRWTTFLWLLAVIIIPQITVWQNLYYGNVVLWIVQSWWFLWGFFMLGLLFFRIWNKILGQKHT